MPVRWGNKARRAARALREAVSVSAVSIAQSSQSGHVCNVVAGCDLADMGRMRGIPSIVFLVFVRLLPALLSCRAAAEESQWTQV